MSKGRKPIEVPDLTGKDATEAASRELSDLGLKVDATEQENSDTVAQGQGDQPEPARRHRCSGATP